MSYFDTLALLPEDPIMGLPQLFQADSRPQKVNLGIGAYQDAEGKPYILNTVTEAEKLRLQQVNSKEYLPIEGNADFIQETLKLILGETLSRLPAKSYRGFQALGGTGALYLGGKLLAQNGYQTLYLSKPTWPNHFQIFTRAGLTVKEYRYYDEKTHAIDFSGLCDDLTTMPAGSIILLQACCHNPTGLDLSLAQWQEVAKLLKKQRVFPFFDLAYQGFGEGIEEDVKALRYFVDQGHELLIANSFSKNFGLYGERVGLLAVITQQVMAAEKVMTQVKQIIRASYSNPPRFGASLVATILQSLSLRESWDQELKNMSSRVNEMRKAFTFGLEAKGLHRDFQFLLKQKGLFSFSGLNLQQVEQLRKEKGIYMIKDGRINVAGLNLKNMDYVIASIISVLT